MDLKTRIDRYITTEPSSGFDDWCDSVVDLFSDSFYEENSDWIADYDGLCDAWLNNLYRKGKSPKEAAKIIEKAHGMSNNKNKM